MSVQQTFQYFRSYPNDRRLFKAWVLAVMFFETLHTSFSVHPCYYFLITNYDNPSALVKNIWSLNLLSPLQTAAMILSQSFYARRVYMLHRGFGLIVAVVTSLLMAAELGFSIAAAVKPFQDTFTFDFAKFAWLITAINGCAIPTDVILTATLMYILLRAKTGFKNTDSMLGTLIIYVINTGLLTGLVTITTLILSRLFPDRYYYIGLTVCGTKVYSNSFLAILNSRKFVSNRMVDDFDGNTYELHSIARSDRTLSNARREGSQGVASADSAPKHIGIRMTRSMA
ncbi:hypothetical protein C8Q79DRAFT_130130 [Trametes meyenii]|nr:hypothetical protein C8Q79DRAFT_130130 [Trametes meyenii]